MSCEAGEYTCWDCCCCWRSSCLATAAPTAVTAEAGRLGAGSVTACTADPVGTCTTTGDATPVKVCPAARELLANVMLPATCQNKS